MKTKVTVRTIYDCTLERAFKTPMLCDVSKVHTGYGPMPRVTHCTEDENWGIPGSSKRVFALKSWVFRGGEVSMDHVLERIENKYWKIEVDQFKMAMLGFTRFTGEWTTNEIAHQRIQIIYTYTLHSSKWYFYPLNWMFTKVFWRIYMKRVLRNIRIMIATNEPYLYA